MLAVGSERLDKGPYQENNPARGETFARFLLRLELRAFTNIELSRPHTTVCLP